MNSYTKREQRKGFNYQNQREKNTNSNLRQLSFKIYVTHSKAAKNPVKDQKRSNELVITSFETLKPIKWEPFIRME